jgi:hypothetical protein
MPSFHEIFQRNQRGLHLQEGVVFVLKAEDLGAVRDPQVRGISDDGGIDKIDNI